MKLLLSLIARIPATRPKDRAPRWRWGVAGLLAAFAMMLVCEVASFFPAFVEWAYASGFSAWATGVLALGSGRVTFSVIEVMLALAGLWLLVPLVPSIMDIVRKRRHASNAIACGLTRTAGAAGITIALFYALWGVNYARTDLPGRVGWDDSTLSTLPRLGSREDHVELVSLCTQLVFVTNYYYEQAMGTRDAGVHSRPMTPAAELDQSIDEGYRRAAAVLGLGESFAQSRGPAKAVAASRVMSNLGIAGFYSPWTGEANYNAESPPFQRPLTIAHEKAHQRCVTSEDEANFLGFLACILSDDPYVRYSGYLFAQRQLLSELMRVDAKAARAIIELRCPGVEQDVYYGRAYWSVFRGPVQSMSLAVNNAYLRANRVEGGLLSYQMSARLLVLFSRYNDGTCVIPPE
ncbi:MAG: DUF3810 domain-containing protein [Candidatus Hydrogenedentes bacterium]|nr:DUF3810 domain-containing protein [Candidatus Hydrogenedentota bacterium]